MIRPAASDNAPLVSVIIPTFNRATMVGQAVESVLAQMQKFALDLKTTPVPLEQQAWVIWEVEYWARTVAAAELQNKSDSYYFQDSRTLGRGELYISPIDLNVDYGHIEIPYVPVIRFATPVFDRQGVKRGVLLLHHLAEPMLVHFDEMLAGSRGQVALLNSEGYWIRAPDRQREWGFMFDNDMTFATTHPRVWTDMQQHASGTIATDDALYTYTTIHPVSLIGGYSAAEVADQHHGHHHTDPESYAWRIVSELPLSLFRQHLYDTLFGVAGLVWLILLLGGVGAAWVIAGHRMERRRMAAEIETRVAGTVPVDKGKTLKAIRHGMVTPVLHKFSRKVFMDLPA